MSRDAQQRLTTIQSDLQQRQWYRRLVSKKYRKRTIRYGLLLANVAVLVVVLAFVTQQPNSSPTAASQGVLPSTAAQEVSNPLDQLSSADIAVHVARSTGLNEATNVANNADTVKAQLSIAPADDVVSAKPQVIATGLKSRFDIKRYTAQAGDTISSISVKFGITSDSVRWSNDLSGEAVTAGKELIIPPISGIAYKVKAGDTADSLSSRYQANKDQLIAFNDVELGALPVGEYIVIPNGVQPRAVTTTTSSSFNFAWGGSSPVYSANGYDYGWCTWHAANRRREIGRPIPSNLGNAITWYYIARNMGMATGSEPRAGAVLWHANMGGLGHVAFVESINADGSLHVSDMNYPIWGRVTYRTVPPSEFGNYRFIY